MTKPVAIRASTPCCMANDRRPRPSSVTRSLLILLAGTTLIIGCSAQDDGRNVRKDASGQVASEGSGAGYSGVPPPLSAWAG